MGNFRTPLFAALGEMKENLDTALDGLSAEELRYQAKPDSNHIAWLVWHTTRAEDMWVGIATRSDQVWVSGGFADRFDMDSRETGYAQSAEQVAAFPEIAIDDLIEYADATRAATLKWLDEVTVESIDDVIVKPRPQDPHPHTIGSIAGHIIVECSEHLGQIAFIRGMQRGLDG